MTLEEFSKYVIDNMTRATVGNALNISLRINGSGYQFVDFIKGVETYIADCIVKNKLTKDKCYGIFYICNKYLKQYNSTFNYNKEYIINDFIIDLWRILNGN